ncbi:hypothetical protein BEP19_01220 [Ammoniphilus oxalaticus]|uniref:Preprotein translocase subunit Tim44 n=2 Tax=Ammoniphilus oxalaticus TaxID=66863 RepID=A0A419SP12_9BACL|nr:hypothetical protein BEP19_01220 [Ammoniphilus oxalaticus]
MKRFFALFTAVVLTLAPLGVITLGLVDDHAEARRGGGGYKSGPRSFKPSAPPKNSSNVTPGNTQRNSNVNQGTNTRTNNPAGAQSNRGGVMRGMLYGGLAGLLFGSLFAGMGGFGALLGLAVNVLAIMVLFMVARRVISYFKEKRDKDMRSWRP